MSKAKLFWTVVILILVVGAGFLGWRYYNQYQEVRGLKAIVAMEHQNNKVLAFMKAFIKQVIKADTEVNFETRLKLENMVRELNDKQILAQWQAFVNSANEVDAQKNVKDLLEILVDKVTLK